jgi:hypothetical protein
MAEKSEVFNQVLKSKGFWNFTELYNFCFNWLVDEGYNVKEKEYVEKIGGAGKEINITWEAAKKVTDYFKNEVNVSWHILGMKDAEIEREGRKESTNKGEVKITIKGNLVRIRKTVGKQSPFGTL